MTAKRKRGEIDWRAVRADYEAGDLTVEQVAQAHGTTASAIKKRAQREKWKRVKQPEAAQFQRQKPLRELIVAPAATGDDAGPARGVDEDNDPPAPQTPVEVILAHRRAAGRARALSERLITELETQTRGLAMFHALIEEAHAGGGVNGAMVRAMLREFLSTGHRAKVLSYITKSLSELVNVEREAFGIATKAASIDDLVAKHSLEQSRAEGAGRSKEEIARALLDMIERASRERQKATMQ